MINVQRTFKNILRQWGHDVYIQRKLNNGNYSEKYELITVRAVPQSGIKNAKSLTEDDNGLYLQYDSVYYCEPDILPKEGDRLYEDYSSQINVAQSRFLIEAVTPVRGRGGKVEYWVIGATRES